MKHKPAVTITSDGEEFTDVAEAQKHQAKLDAGSRLALAQQEFILTVCESTRTADGFLFDFSRWQYFNVYRGHMSPPRVERVTVDRWHVELATDTQLATVFEADVKGREARRWAIQDLYQDEDRARQACLQRWAEWLNEQRQESERLAAAWGIRHLPTMCLQPNPKRVIFLDIDGVLNDHSKTGSGYCDISEVCASRFNSLLDALPDLKIVVTSAWRYMILRGDASVLGFEQLLLTHGVKAHDRVIGHTAADGLLEDEPNHHDKEAWHAAGLIWRRQQIVDWIDHFQPTTFAIVDDLQLDMGRQVLTDGKIGLTDDDVDKLLQLLK